MREIILFVAHERKGKFGASFLAAVKVTNPDHVIRDASQRHLIVSAHRAAFYSHGVGDFIVLEFNASGGRFELQRRIVENVSTSW